MIILDININTQYDLDSVGGKLMNVEFSGGDIESLSDWPTISTQPAHRGNFVTWEEAEYTILISGSNRTVLEKRISWLKSLMTYAEVYATELGFDFRFRGELSSFNVDYKGANNALVKATMKGRKLAVAQTIQYSFTTENSGTARVSFLGNTRVPLRIDMEMESGEWTPAGFNISCKNNRGTTLWTETINLKQWQAPNNCIITIDGTKGAVYVTNPATNVRENWVENYSAKFLPYIEARGDVLTVALIGALGGHSINVKSLKLTYEGRWV